MTEALIVFIALCLGSFLNVCIYRLPVGKSLWRPGSHCPKCSHSIAWFDNIPVLSFLLLGGKCRHCRKGIPIRYPTVELATALVWFWSWKASATMPGFWITGTFLSLLIVVSLTDLETGSIPDAVSYFGIGLGLAASFVYPALQGSLTPIGGLAESAMGAAVGSVLMFVMAVVGSWIFQRESMGDGDVKLLGMIGSFLGWEKVLLTFFAAPFLALPFALYQQLGKREEEVPYGPFLSLAGGVLFFYGNLLWQLFLGL
jgi:leader peptidase (prepilin peptidase)/N-methyltransferase